MHNYAKKIFKIKQKYKEASIYIKKYSEVCRCTQSWKRYAQVKHLQNTTSKFIKKII